MGNSPVASRTHHRVNGQTRFIFHPSTRLLFLSVVSSSFLLSSSFPRHLLLCCHLYCCRSFSLALIPTFLCTLSPQRFSHDNNDGNSEQHKICPFTIQSSLAVSARQFQYLRHLFLSHQDMTFDQQTRLSPAAVAWGQQVWKL